MSPERESGTYRYRRDGVLLGVSDVFWVDGASVRAVREQTGGVRMELDATIDGLGLVRRFDLVWTHPADGQIARRFVTYELLDGSLEVTVDGVGQMLTVAPDTVLFPLLRVCQGAAILAVADAGPIGRTVIIPDLHHLSDPEKLLYPTVEIRTARWLSTDASSGVSTYSYEGSVYDGSARFFIDVGRRQMTGYRFPQADGSVIDVQLER